MMGDIMQFPETVEEFMQQYKITDTQQVYTNGTELVPIFRMKQWFEAHKRRWIPCSERLPENRDVWEQYTVLLCVYRPAWYGDDEYTVEKFVLPAEYNYEQKVWRVSGSGEIINALIEEKSPWRSYISHWMPLPEPPEEEQNETD